MSIIAYNGDNGDIVALTLNRLIEMSLQLPYNRYLKPFLGVIFYYITYRSLKKLRLNTLNLNCDTCSSFDSFLTLIEKFFYLFKCIAFGIGTLETKL